MSGRASLFAFCNLRFTFQYSYKLLWPPPSSFFHWSHHFAVSLLVQLLFRSRLTSVTIKGRRLSREREREHSLSTPSWTIPSSSWVWDIDFSPLTDQRNVCRFSSQLPWLLLLSVSRFLFSKYSISMFSQLDVAVTKCIMSVRRRARRSVDRKNLWAEYSPWINFGKKILRNRNYTFQMACIMMCGPPKCQCAQVGYCNYSHCSNNY